MKKSSFHYFVDTTFYYVIALSPILILFFSAIFGGYDDVKLFISSFDGIFSNTFLYDSIFNVVGSSGVSPLFNESTNIIIDFIVYVIYCTVIHLLIDCLQFIPSLCHHFLDKFGGKDFE